MYLFTSSGYCITTLSSRRDVSADKKNNKISCLFILTSILIEINFTGFRPEHFDIT